MNLIHSIINAITTPIRQLFQWFVQCLPGMKALGRWSIPIKWSLLTLIFLMMIWTAAYIKHRLDVKGRIWDWNDWLIWFILPIPMVIGISIFVYYFVKLYLKEEGSRFPELDRIWSEGLEASAEKDIIMSQTPLFLVLGVSTYREVKSLTSLIEIDFPVQVPTGGSPPLAYYASEQGIFVFLNGCNCISRLSTSNSVAPSMTDPSSGSELLPTDIGGTIQATHMAVPQFSTMQVPDAVQPNEHFQPGGTMLLSEGQSLGEIWKSDTTSKVLTSNEIVDAEDRLRHVCGLIRKARLPLCPINGIVSTIPFDLIESSSAQLQIAIQKDLAILRQEFQVRCPNTVLVTGMENEEGFVELIKRIPAKKLSENRFGKGSDIWVSPEVARLDAIAIHATATFEDWIYMLFQEENALKKKHNSKLFSMLCRVRGVFSENLRSVLSRGFGFDPQTQPDLAHEQFLFGGCYFAATGATSTQQAFVKSVFAKTMQQEGELEWAPEARVRDNYYHAMANFAALIGTLALIAIAVMLILRFAIPTS